jgi:hypothetical protein
MAELSKENSLQREAFELYYHLGDKRSLKRVAEQIERTERTVAGWSRMFNWADRVKQREIEDAMNEGVNRLNAHTTDIKTRYRILINNLITQASKKVASGELSIKNISDLERVVKLDLLLMGEATDRQDNTGSTELSKADKERLDVIAKLLEGKS